MPLMALPFLGLFKVTNKFVWVPQEEEGKEGQEEEEGEEEIGRPATVVVRTACLCSNVLLYGDSS